MFTKFLDHVHMLAHLTERVIVKDKDGQLPERDCLTVVNATQNALQPLLSSSACEVKVRRKKYF